MILPPGTAGVDAGATLSKLVFEPAGLEQFRVPSTDLAAVRERLSSWQPRRLGTTGGGAGQLADLLGGAEVVVIEEFKAWAAGAPVLAAETALELPAAYLLVSLGTGTSVLAIHGREARRVGGSALGGGTLLGLGSLLAGTASFADLARLAAQGDRRRVDLLVGDIYRQGGIALPAELNAASFGKLASQGEADLAHALMGLVGENIAIIATALAKSEGVDAILYCGSTLDANPALEAILTTTTRAFGGTPLYLAHGAFCGAIGAARLAG